MSENVRYFGWMYFRALVWISLSALFLYRATKSGKVSRAYVLAHLAALGFGVLLDLFFLNCAPRSWLRIEVLQWAFTAPIVIFTAISLWIGNWENTLKVPDVFMALVPVVLWGLLVIYGWQDMYECHVLGAWFVCATAGAVDLAARYGPAWARKRSFLARAAGYVVLVLAVYLLLPHTELQIRI